MAATSSLDHLSNRMKLEWHSKLNTEMVPAKNYRRTSIIGTIGMSSYPSLPSAASSLQVAMMSQEEEGTFVLTLAGPQVPKPTPSRRSTLSALVWQCLTIESSHCFLIHRLTGL